MTSVRGVILSTHCSDVNSRVRKPKYGFKISRDGFSLNKMKDALQVISIAEVEWCCLLDGGDKITTAAPSSLIIKIER